MVENQTLNQELLKYKPKIDKSKNDKQSYGYIIRLLIYLGDFKKLIRNKLIDHKN